MSNNTDDTVNSKDEAKTPAKMNAFQFMMNSRHKIIGSNSPGKEKKDVELKSPEITEKTKEKLNKRKVVFENWSEKKGGTKRKLLDEAAENHINKTLHKRAKRLKKMLDIIDEELKNSGEESSDNDDVVIKVKTRKYRVPLCIDSDNSSNSENIIRIEPQKMENGDNEKQQNHAIVKRKIQNNIEYESKVVKDSFSEENCKENIENNAVGTEKQIKNISQEEINTKLREISEKEIIDKKKENNNKSAETNSTKKGQNNRNSSKKIIRKNSLSLRKTKDVKEISTVPRENKLDKSQENNAGGELSDEEIFPTEKNEASKKARQTKHNNDSVLNTKKSEEIKKECFSPRAWRMKLRANENNGKKLDNNESEYENSENKHFEMEEPEKEESKELENLIVGSQNQGTNEDGANCSGSKKQVKLAPIFLKQQSKKLDKIATNAKKNFLHSGMPSKVKKLMPKSKSFQEPEYTFNIFPKISHIQQRTADDTLNTFWELPDPSLHLLETNKNTNLLFDKINIGSFTNCKSLDINTNTDNQYAPPLKYHSLKEIVTEIKKEHPSYPVYKTFRLLYQKYEKHINKSGIKIQETQKIETSKPKRGRPKKKKQTMPEECVPIKLNQVNELSGLETLMWTEKYRPQCQEDIIGNTTAVQELKSWLESWIRYSEDQKYSRKRRQSNSSDDFCSDSTTKDSDNLPQTLMLLFGPLGSGKTSSVYGLCNDLNINIIEINASSKRTGKKILVDLQEATQSHQVKNTDNKSVNSFFQKKPDSQNEDDVNKKLSLLLFEDVDIVFEDQDDNFISAVATLVTSSKRPIILTYTDNKCPHLQKFILQHTVITFNSLSSKILGPWLQILCLVEGVNADKDMIDKLVQWNKGDVRKTVLQLQFWIQTRGEIQEDLIESIKLFSSTVQDEEICVDDEGLDILWMNVADIPDTRNKNSNLRHQNCAESFIPYYERDKEGFKLSYPVNLEVLWWNVPEILNQNTNNFLTKKYTNEIKIEEKEKFVISKQIENRNSLDKLNITVKFLESLAFTDVVHTRLKTECYNEPVYNYWQINPVNSLSLNQNFSMYKQNNDTSLEIAHWIVENNVNLSRKLCGNKNIKFDANIAVPHFEEVSWRSKRHKSMKELLSAVPIISILDRRAICEDYQPILRSISRTENERFATNNKRKNRFYHYLKNFNIHMNDSTYLLLDNTLATNSVD